MRLELCTDLVHFNIFEEMKQGCPCTSSEPSTFWHSTIFPWLHIVVQVSRKSEHWSCFEEQTASILPSHHFPSQNSVSERSLAAKQLFRTFLNSVQYRFAHVRVKPFAEGFGG